MDSQVVVTFTHLSAANAGPLGAYATTSADFDVSTIGRYVEVAIVEPVPPVLYTDNSTLLSAAKFLTVRGTGFDSMNMSNNLLSLTVSNRSLNFDLLDKATDRESTQLTQAVMIYRATRTELVVKFCDAERVRPVLPVPGSAMGSLERNPLAYPWCAVQRNDDGAVLRILMTNLGSGRLQSNNTVVAVIEASSPCEQIARDADPCSHRGVPHNYLDAPLAEQFCQCECNCTKLEVPDKASGFSLRQSCNKREEQPSVYYGVECANTLDSCQQRCYTLCHLDNDCSREFAAFTKSNAGSQYPNDLTDDAVQFFRFLKSDEDAYREEYSTGSFFSCMDAAAQGCPDDLLKPEQNVVPYFDNQLMLTGEMPKSASVMLSSAWNAIHMLLWMIALIAIRIGFSA